jgi:quercetin dioxygenase-like cupin family protein
MNRLLVLSVSLAALVAAAPAPKTHEVLTFTPEAVSWGPAPAGLPAGAQAAKLEGDPAKAGYFAIRLKAPVGYKVMPHTHPGSERVTVIEGTLYLGHGATFDESALKAYPAGSYISMPAGHRHFAMFKDGGVIQIATIGPWGIKYVDPKDDPRQAK